METNEIDDLSPEKANSRIECHYIHLKKFISDQLIDIFLNELNSSDFKTAGVHADLVLKHVRNTKKICIERKHWMSSILSDIAVNINKQFFNFYVDNSFQVEVLKYDVGGEYAPHHDTFLSYDMFPARKITAICLLNEDFIGGTFSFLINNSYTNVELSKGDVLVFPSFTTHVVKPIVKGVRFSLVTWLEGPQFR